MHLPTLLLFLSVKHGCGNIACIVNNPNLNPHPYNIDEVLVPLVGTLSWMRLLVYSVLKIVEIMQATLLHKVASSYQVAIKALHHFKKTLFVSNIDRISLVCYTLVPYTD